MEGGGGWGGMREQWRAADNPFFISEVFDYLCAFVRFSRLAVFFVLVVVAVAVVAVFVVAGVVVVAAAVVLVVVVVAVVGLVIVAVTAFVAVVVVD